MIAQDHVLFLFFADPADPSDFWPGVATDYEDWPFPISRVGASTPEYHVALRERCEEGTYLPIDSQPLGPTHQPPGSPEIAEPTLLLFEERNLSPAASAYMLVK
jgi:hypothetical protein